ncbi:MAG: hypothetical protein ACI30S_03980 [Muribaculaceae bacterium]
MDLKNHIISKKDGSAPVKGDLFDRRFPVNIDATEMVIACDPDDYSAALIARAVEDCNAHVLNLNLTGERTDKGDLIVDIRVNHRNGDHIARSLERYGFEVLDYAGTDDDDDDTARERALEILKILDI